MHIVPGTMSTVATILCTIKLQSIFRRKVADITKQSGVEESTQRLRCTLLLLLYLMNAAFLAAQCPRRTGGFGELRFLEPGKISVRTPSCPTWAEGICYVKLLAQDPCLMSAACPFEGSFLWVHDLLIIMNTLATTLKLQSTATSLCLSY